MWITPEWEGEVLWRIRTINEAPRIVLIFVSIVCYNVLMPKAGNSIRIGRFKTASGDLGMSPDQRGRHLYVVGSTGVGKSKLLERLIRQDIKSWQPDNKRTQCGLLLLDPHGSVYQSTIEWLAAGGKAALKRPVIPIDLTQDEWVVGYNLLKRRTTASASVVVGAMMNAVMHVFGATSIWSTPLLARWLHNTLRLLYDRQATLTELVPLLDDPAFRAHLIDSSKDAMTRSDWKRAAKYKPERFEDEIGSTLNRLQAFIRNDLLEAAFGQTRNTLDLRKAMDEGWIILVNCSQSGGKMSKFDCQLYATMMLSDLWTAASERRKDKGKPFYVYVDEFQNFVTETMAENLDQARGYGLHLTLAHQYPKQLKHAGPAGEKVYDSVMANAGSKVVFRMEHPEGLDTLAKWLYMGTVNPDKVQLELYSTKVMSHREETRIIRTITSSQTNATGSSASEDSGDSSGKSVARHEDEDGEESTRKEMGEQTGSSSRRGSSTTETESTTDGESTAELPMLVPVYGQERTSVTFESLDIQWFRQMQKIAGQQDRECVARLVGMIAPLPLRTIEVSPVKENAKRVHQYLRKRYKKLKFALSMPDAKRLMQERQSKLMDEARIATLRDESTLAKKRLKPKSPKNM